MWDCTKCGERIEDSFEVCWNCGTWKDGREDPDFRPEGTPEDRAGPREQAGSTGRSRPRTWLLAAAVYGFVLAFTPRPTGFQEDPMGEIFGLLPFWVLACLPVLMFGVGVLMGNAIFRLMVIRAPVGMLKSGPSWFKRMFNFDWPPHWCENVFWGIVGVGVGVSIAAPFVGVWALFYGVFTLIGGMGILLGFRLAARQLDGADGE